VHPIFASPGLASVGWPVLDRFRFGNGFAISPHGLGIAIGFMIGGWLLGRIGVRRGVAPEHISTMLFWALIGAIIGSRVAYVIAHLSEFSSPLEWLYVWKGGISLLGGITGAIVINIRRMHTYGYRFFQVMDPAAVALAMGIGIGRIGDLIIGDHLGKPTSWLLAWTYHGGNLAPPFTCVNGVCQAQLQGGHLEEIQRSGAKLIDASGKVLATGIGVHQTALYDMILAWILFAILWRLYMKPRREGVITLTFGLYYGCCRLLEDSLRIDKRFGPFTGSQWTALTVAIVSAGILIWWALQSRSRPRDGGPAGGDNTPRDDTHGDDADRDDEPEQAIGAIESPGSSPPA
jgi:phosphatidylglycerol:prolipoprotein diacylglycerol transferase